MHIEEVICRDYWWLAAEWFTVAGAMGIGPGTGEYVPEDDAYRNYHNFIEDVERIPRSCLLDRLIKNKYSDKLTDHQRQEYQRILEGVKEIGSDALYAYYGRHVHLLTEYQMAACRPYLYLSDMGSIYQEICTAGLVILISKPGFNRRVVLKRKTTLIYGRATRVI